MVLHGRRANRLASLASAVVWMLGACTFPEFVFVDEGPDSGGQGGDLGGGAPGEGGAAGDDGGARGGSADGGASAGAAGEAGAGGAPQVGPCGAPAFPEHCANDVVDGGETDVDCGGPSCAPCGADEACLVDDDCATGACTDDQCERPLTLSYVRQTAENAVASFQFRVTIDYLAAQSVLLRDLSLRYHFSRNSVAEPIVAGGSVTIGPGSTMVTPVLRVVRQLRGNGVDDDAYLEIGFDGGEVIGQGDTLDMTITVDAGGGSNLFSQETHHSFDSGTALHETKTISAHLDGQRVWGRGPAHDDPRTCFHRGVNLNGPAVTVGSDDWSASPDSELATYEITGLALKPDPDEGRDEMLRAGFRLEDESFFYPVENGEYGLIVYAASADTAMGGTLTVQGEPLDVFNPRSFDGGAAWAALGGYRVAVTDGQLEIGADGVLHLGGFELVLLDE